jgi:hypothetical protein
MVRDVVEDHLQPTLVRRPHERIEVGQRPKERVYAAVVGDVVAEIGHGRWKDRREPDRIYPKLNEMVEALIDSVEITDAIAIGVLKRARRPDRQRRFATTRTRVV